MTLTELYSAIGGDYEAAAKVLRIEKLIDKHIRKLPANGIFAGLADAGASMDGPGIFESAHAIKGVCSNLGLVGMARIANELCEEFRPGNTGTMTDGEVKEKINEIDSMFKKASGIISEYEQPGQ